MTDFRALCAEILAILDDYENNQRVDWDDWRSRTRAALAQPEPQEPTGCPAIEPVPVAERLPGPEDCDAEGRSWFGGKRGIWMLMTSKYAMADSFWLPHHALPVPQP